MSKTIKQIAEEIGVSKQAIFKKIKREPLSTSLQGFTSTVDGKLIVSVDGENLIKKAFSDIKPSTKPSTKTETKNCEITDLVSVLKTSIEVLKEELKAKDEQLATKDRHIEQLQTLLSQEQQLNAANFLENKSFPKNPSDNNKKGFFSRFFGK